MSLKDSLPLIQSKSSHESHFTSPSHDTHAMSRGHRESQNNSLAIHSHEISISDDSVPFSTLSSEEQPSSGSLSSGSADKQNVRYSTEQIGDIMKRRTQLMEDLNINNNVTGGSITKSLEYTNPSSLKSVISKEEASDRLSRKSEHPKVYSRATLVKELFSDFYRSLETYETEVQKDQDGNILYPGIEGVFNPLQIMRNRRIRKSEGVSLRKGVFSKVKLPSQTFSRHKRPRLIWQINPYEYSGDFIWRRTHLAQLRRPNGQLWLSKKLRYIRGNQEIGNGLPLDDGWNSFGFKSPSAYSEKEKRPNTELSLDVNESSASKARHEQYENKNRTKSLVKMVGNHTATNDRASLSPSRWYPGMLTTSNVSVRKREALSNSNGLALRSFNNNRDLSYASIPTHSRENSAFINSTSGGSSGSTFKEEVLLIKQIDHRLNSSNLQMRNSTIGFKQLLSESSARFSRRLNCFETLQAENQSKSRRLANQIEEIDEIIHSLSLSNGKQSMQLEELLGYCDRTNGEINTSITLKIRDLNERLDKLMTNDNDTLMNMFYNFVEMIIVLFLWMIWVVVEVLRFTKGSARIILGIIKWILF